MRFRLVNGAATLVIEEKMGRVVAWQVEGKVDSSLARGPAHVSEARRQMLQRDVAKYLSSHPTEGRTALAMFRACPTSGMSPVQVGVSWGEPDWRLRSVKPTNQLSLFRYRLGIEGQFAEFQFFDDKLVLYREYW